MRQLDAEAGEFNDRSPPTLAIAGSPQVAKTDKRALMVAPKGISKGGERGGVSVAQQAKQQ